MPKDLKIYRGYANQRKILIMGHVFEKNTPDIFKLDRKGWKHAKQVFQMFRVKTLANISITISFGNIRQTTKTLDDGHFRVMIPYEKSLSSGWHTFKVTVNDEKQTLSKKGEFIKPYPGEYGIISDIDDTFLISHSNNFFKKLYVMLTKNLYKRKVFTGVVNHYRELEQLGREDKNKNNAFFYVSSSEWNLYNFISAFTDLHRLPKGVLQLKEIKNGIRDFIKTGRGDHQHKFYKIRHIVEFYPELQFILLGDDSQKDAKIYQDIIKIFPANIYAVYIRQTTQNKKKEIKKILENISTLGVQALYFKSSKEAIEHSQNKL
ncbi:App1 family protein [Mesonia sediminis]|uniref:App1 family protein n=1 Tax=Mesonia sediminis TaxID=1703946 RepID=A0ABW5SDG2_9FLAO